MKRTVFILLAMVLVLFSINLALANGKNSNSAVNFCPLTTEKIEKIIPNLTILSDATKETLRITNEELFLYPGIYWIFGESFQTYCLDAPTFLSLPPGIYTIYIIPERLFLVAEMIKKQARNK